MFLKKPFVSIVFLVGIFLFASFTINFLLPLISNSSLVTAIAEILIVMLCLVAVVFEAAYLLIKRQQKPTEKELGTVTRLPLKDSKPGVSSMTMTG
jgi:hypothetical protein